MFASTFAGLTLFSLGGCCSPCYKPVPQYAPPCCEHGHGIVVHYVYPRMSPYHSVYHPPVVPVLPVPKNEEPKKKGL